MNIATLAIDISKNTFQLHGVSDNGHVLLRKCVKRGHLLTVIANLPPCRIGMEACASAHHWGRLFGQYGHDVRLVSPQFVKPFVKSQKNDANDAEAICEAIQRPTMRYVPVKTVEQQTVLSIHRVRERQIKERTALVNQIRGLLGEFGITVRKSVTSLRSAIPQILEDGENELTPGIRSLLSELREELYLLDKRIKNIDRRLEELAKHDPASSKLMEIRGIGPLTATALAASIGDPKYFRNGRQLAAWLGLVPRQHSTGGKPRLYGISKRGNVYLRTLLIHCGRVVVQRSRGAQTPNSDWIRSLAERRGFNKACVAQANKLARVAWATLQAS